MEDVQQYTKANLDYTLAKSGFSFGSNDKCGTLPLGGVSAGIAAGWPADSCKLKLQSLDPLSKPKEFFSTNYMTINLDGFIHKNLVTIPAIHSSPMMLCVGEDDKFDLMIRAASEYSCSIKVSVKLAKEFHCVLDPLSPTTAVLKFLKAPPKDWPFHDEVVVMFGILLYEENSKHKSRRSLRMRSPRLPKGLQEIKSRLTTSRAQTIFMESKRKTDKVTLMRYNTAPLMEQKAQQLEKKPGQLELKYGHLEQKPGQLELKHGHLEQKPGQLEQKPGKLEQKSGQLEKELEQLEQKSGGVPLNPSDSSFFTDEDQLKEHLLSHYRRVLVNSSAIVSYVRRSVGDVTSFFDNSDSGSGDRSRAFIAANILESDRKLKVKYRLADVNESVADVLKREYSMQILLRVELIAYLSRYSSSESSVSHLVADCGSLLRTLAMSINPLFTSAFLKETLLPNYIDVIPDTVSALYEELCLPLPDALSSSLTDDDPDSTSSFLSSPSRDELPSDPEQRRKHHGRFSMFHSSSLQRQILMPFMKAAETAREKRRSKKARRSMSAALENVKASQIKRNLFLGSPVKYESIVEVPLGAAGGRAGADRGREGADGSNGRDGSGEGVLRFYMEKTRESSELNLGNGKRESEKVGRKESGKYMGKTGEEREKKISLKSRSAKETPERRGKSAMLSRQELDRRRRGLLEADGETVPETPAPLVVPETPECNPLGVQRSASGVHRGASGVQRSVSGVQRSASGVQRNTSDTDQPVGGSVRLTRRSSFYSRVSKSRAAVKAEETLELDAAAHRAKLAASGFFTTPTKTQPGFFAADCQLLVSRRGVGGVGDSPSENTRSKVDVTPVRGGGTPVHGGGGTPGRSESLVQLPGSPSSRRTSRRPNSVNGLPTSPAGTSALVWRVAGCGLDASPALREVSTASLVAGRSDPFVVAFRERAATYSEGTGAQRRRAKWNGLASQSASRNKRKSQEVTTTNHEVGSPGSDEEVFNEEKRFRVDKNDIQRRLLESTNFPSVGSAAKSLSTSRQRLRFQSSDSAYSTRSRNSADPDLDGDTLNANDLEILDTESREASAKWGTSFAGVMGRLRGNENAAPDIVGTSPSLAPRVSPAITPRQPSLAPRVSPAITPRQPSLPPRLSPAITPRHLSQPSGSSILHLMKSPMIISSRSSSSSPNL